VIRAARTGGKNYYYTAVIGSSGTSGREEGSKRRGNKRDSFLRRLRYRFYFVWGGVSKRTGGKKSGLGVFVGRNQVLCLGANPLC